MKRTFKPLFTLLFTALVGATAFGVANSFNQQVKEAEAAYQNLHSGTYSKITKLGDLVSGDKVVIRALNTNKIITGIGANPASIYGGNDNISFNDSTITCTDADYVEFTVVINDNGDDPDTYAFKGTIAFNHASYDIHTGFISYFDQNEGCSSFKTVGYFKYRLGIRETTSTNEKVTWTLSMEQGSGLTRATNSHDGNTHLSFYGDVLTRDNDGFYIYKNTSQIAANITLLEGPDIYRYGIGEEIDLAGLRIQVTRGASNEEVRYVDHPERFFYAKYATGGEGQTLRVTYIDGDVNDTFNVSLIVTDASNTYSKITEARNDYRGEYIIAGDTGYTNYRPSDYGPDPIEYEDYASLNGYTGSQSSSYLDGNVINLLANNNKWQYYIFLEKNADGYYRMYVENNGKHYIYVNSIDGTLSFEDSHPTPDNTQLDVEFVDGEARLKMANSNNVLRYDGGFRFMSSGGHTTCLYGRSLRETNTEMEVTSFYEFLSALRDATESCDPTGVEERIASASWEWLENAFNNLSLNVQGVLASVEYVHNQEMNDTVKDLVKDLIDRYDYIVNKYGYKDFMQRGSLIAQLQNVNSTPRIPVQISEDNTSIVVVVIACSAITLFAVIFFIQKKKHQ